MRKLIESTLVSLDGVVEAPERWASFDAEAAAYSLEQLCNYDAFVMGRVTYEKFFAYWGHAAGAGRRLFEDVDTSGLHLRLTGERSLGNGSVILTYAPGPRGGPDEAGAPAGNEEEK
jgi:hypothetical protein